MADIKKLSEGTVKDAQKALPNLSDAELNELEQAEKDGDGRVTLLEAIESEREGRKGDEPELTGREARLATMTADFSE